MNVILGVFLIALGIGTLWAQMFTTLASVYFLGWVLMIAGVAQMLYGISAGGLQKSLLFFITGLLSIGIGLVAVINTALSAVTFTLFIAGLLLVSGTYRILSNVMSRTKDWTAITAGVISLILGISIILSWPVSGLFVIGLFIGIELIINGAILMAQPAMMFDKTIEYPTYPYLSGIKGGRAKKDDKKEHKEPKTNKTDHPR